MSLSPFKLILHKVDTESKDYIDTSQIALNNEIEPYLFPTCHNNPLMKSPRKESALTMAESPKLKSSQNGLPSVQTTANRDRSNSMGKKKWALIRNTISAINQFQAPCVRKLTNVEDLTRDIEEYCNSPLNSLRKENSRSQCPSSPLEGAKREMKMHKYISRGSARDCIKLREFLLSAPCLNLYGPGDYRSMQNKRNSHGLTPLFIATMNGNINVVKMLLEHKANPTITSILNESEEETILETACRWNHIHLISLYIKQFEWNLNTLQKALKVCRSEMAKAEVQRKILSILKEYTCGCLCCYSYKKSARICPETHNSTTVE